MSRDKKPKKANKRKYTDPKTGNYRHADGDRRRRDVGPDVKQAIRDKQIRREFDGGTPTDDPPAAE